MRFSKAILILACTYLTNCSNFDRREAEWTEGEIFMGTCYNDKIPGNKFPILKDHYIFEDYLIKNELLKNRDKKGYLTLMDRLLNGKTDINLHDFLEKNDDSHLMYEPSNIGWNRYCWEQGRENYPREITIVFISDKLDKMDEIGDIGNWTINKDLIEGIPDDCYSKDIYRVPLNTLLYGIASYKRPKKRVD